MDNTDLSAMIQKIMQNPEFAGMVSELRGEGGKKSTEDITGDMMAHLPDVLAMVGPMLGNMSSGSPAAEEIPAVPDNRQTESGEKAKTAAPGEILPRKYDKGKAEKLLFAIKPYLSSSRCGIIDKCVSVMQLGDVMGALQGLDVLNKLKKNNDEGGK